MNQELWLLAASVVLGLVQISLVSRAQKAQRSTEWYKSSRDEAVPPLTGVAGRLERAFKNYSETFPLFAAAVLMAQVADRHGWLTLIGAHLYFWGRVAYVPFYALGKQMFRSTAWGFATLGTLLILIGLA
ncbi:MAG: MAPEG family protein [Alphaproteobacteria bacterium]|nr:MAPEG family protein [Alphaproteobacteria bacterium]